MSRLALLKAQPWCLRTNGRRVACSLCDRGAIIEWRGQLLCRSHWRLTERIRMAKASARERQNRAEKASA